MSYNCSPHSGDLSWRFPLSLQTAPGLILTCSICFLPESPRWLIGIGKDQAGRSALTLPHLNRDATNNQLVERELNQIHESIAYEQRERWPLVAPAPRTPTMALPDPSRLWNASIHLVIWCKCDPELRASIVQLTGSLGLDITHDHRHLGRAGAALKHSLHELH